MKYKVPKNKPSRRFNNCSRVLRRMVCSAASWPTRNPKAGDVKVGPTFVHGFPLTLSLSPEYRGEGTKRPPASTLPSQQLLAMKALNVSGTFFGASNSGVKGQTMECDFAQASCKLLLFRPTAASITASKGSTRFNRTVKVIKIRPEFGQMV